MTKMELRMLLLAWAHLARGMTESLGYPRRAAFIMGRGYSTEPDWPPALRQVEAALCALRHESATDFRLLTRHYLCQHKPTSVLAAEARLTGDEYQARLDVAEARLLIKLNPTPT